MPGETGAPSAYVAWLLRRRALILAVSLLVTLVAGYRTVRTWSRDSNPASVASTRSGGR